MSASFLPMNRFKAIRFPLQTLMVWLCLATSGLRAQVLPVAQNLVDFNSSEGEQLLIGSQEARQDYFPLSMYFVTQENLAYCGVASIVMVLNALSIPAPEAPEYRTYRVFTQENLFSQPQTRQIMTAEAVARGGMTLEQLGQLLETYPVEATVFHGENVTLEEFRTLVTRNLQEPGNFILVNYLRSAIGQERGGHISPLAAYNEQTDRVLILDVARYKYPPVWVELEELWQAMKTIDAVSGRTRGFVTVSPLQTQQSIFKEN